MPDCEQNIREIDARPGVAQQWVIGPVGDEDPSFYTGEIAGVDCILEATDNISTFSVTIAFFGETNAANYNGEWHWQSVVTPLEIFQRYLQDLVDAMGYYSEQEALLQLAEHFMPDRQWANVSSVAITDHIPG